MSFPLGLALLDALLPIVGASFLALFGVADSLGAGVRLLGLAYLTGWALLGVVMSLLLMAGLSLSVASIAVVAAVLFLVCAVWARRRPVALLVRPRIPSSRVDVWVSRIGAVVLCVGGAAAVVVAIRGEWNPAHDFDALFFYLPRADSISTTHGLHAALWRQFPHPEYPPLFPVTTAAIFVFAGFHPSLQLFQQTLLGLAFLLGMLGMLDRVAPRRFSVPSLTLLATTPWFWGSLQSLLPDQTVAYLIAAAALACALWLLEPHPAWLALGTLFLAAGTLTKLEGMLSAVALAAVVVVTSLLHFGRRGTPAALLLLGPATIVFWRIWLHANGLRGTSSVFALSDAVDPTYLDHRVARLRYAAHVMTVFWAGMLSEATPLARLGTSWRVEAWLLGIALAVLLIFAARSSRAVAAAVACWLVLAFAGLAMIYWIGRIPVVVYVAESVDRVEETPLMVTLTLLPLLLALALRIVPGRSAVASRDKLDRADQPAPMVESAPP